MEIKSKQTVTRGEVGEDNREKEEGSSKNMRKGHMDKAKGWQDQGQEVGMSGEEESGEEKMEVTT